jgi:TIR domain-containing protein
MPVIFVSYRRSDSQDVTGRIYDRLLTKFSRQQVFKDVDNIPLGVSFPLHLKQMLGKAGAVLIIIGPNWVTATDQQGRRRLDDPGDYVRIEVEAALSANIPVIPVLVSNASMPKASELPLSLQKLVERNGMPVRPDPDFNNDIERLFSGLEHLEKLRNPPKKPQKVENPGVEPKREPTSKDAPGPTEMANQPNPSAAAKPMAKSKSKFAMVAVLIAAFTLSVLGVFGFLCCNITTAIGRRAEVGDIDGHWETQSKRYYNFDSKLRMLTVVALKEGGMSECDYRLSFSNQLWISPRERNEFKLPEETYQVTRMNSTTIRLEPLNGKGDAILLKRISGQEYKPPSK